MPLLSPDAARAGVFPGGEGGQWPRGPIAVSPADPDFLLLPIDVGGVYRSLDGGSHWSIAMVGWDARGANAFAIDPRNAKHVLGVGSNSMDWEDGWGPSPGGIYLSRDKAASWKHVLAAREGVGGAVAFDPHSFDPGKGICTVAYFLSVHQGLLRSEDGGETWQLAAQGDATAGRVDRDWTQGGGIISKLHVADDGTVYIGSGNGLFRSADQGRHFTQLRKEGVFGLAVGANGLVAVSGAGSSSIAASHDGGNTFAVLPCAGLDTLGGKPVQDLVVSPVDPHRMLCWVAGDNWNWVRYISQDGGQTFARVTTDKGLAPLPMNARQGYATWSPKDASIAWSIGGDWATKSTDGGRTFQWSNNGYNGIMVGGLFNISPRNPETVLLGVQDYNGAFTTDGGKTWNYRDISGKGWGGHEYGSFAASRRLMWTGDADSWGTPRRLRISRDGGATWAFVNGADGKPLTWKGADVSFADPADVNALFASDLHSSDGGATWERMTDCEGVFAASPGTGALYGKKGNAIVRSVDHGRTWQVVTEVPGGFGDLAVDHQHGRIYVASEDRLKVWDGRSWSMRETPKDQFGNSRVWTVATDPVDPSVIYIGGPRNTYASHTTICRSTDGGATWENLTVNTSLSDGMEGGPHEVSCIRVNPKTREAWVAGQCFGLWRIAPPKSGERGVPAALASAPIATIPPALPVVTTAATHP